MSYHAKTTLRHDIHATTCDISGQPGIVHTPLPLPRLLTMHKVDNHDNQDIYTRKKIPMQKTKKIGGKGGLRNLW